MSHHWQGSLTYTLAGLWDQDPPPLSGFTEGAVPGGAGPGRRTVAGGDRSAASAGVQRHLAGGPRLPGERHLLLRFGPAHPDRLRLRRARTADRQRRSLRCALRRPTVIIPREASSAQPIHRVEMRLQQRVPLRGQRDDRAAIVEIFNLFNRANYGSYDLTETSPTFGQPTRARISPTRRAPCSSASGSTF